MINLVSSRPYDSYYAMENKSSLWLRGSELREEICITFQMCYLFLFVLKQVMWAQQTLVYYGMLAIIMHYVPVVKNPCIDSNRSSVLSANHKGVARCS